MKSNLSVKDISYNTAIFVNSDSACENNCPWCNLWVKKADLSKKLALEELKNRIDYLSENINYWWSLIFQPWNILLDYEIHEIEELFEYASKKTNKLIQWEIAKLDPKILNFLESEKIKELIKTQKLFLNIWYLVKNLELLKKIFAVIVKLWKENVLEEIISKWFEKDFSNLNNEEYLEKLHLFISENKIDVDKNKMLFSIHNIANLDSKIDDLTDFMNFCGFDIDKIELKEIIKKNVYFPSIESWVYIQFLSLEENKIIDWTVIWAETYNKWDEKCILNEWTELDILWDWTIRFHTNPCNSIKFWDIKSSNWESIDKAFEEHKKRIFNIMVKYKWTKDFNQSILCTKCINWENPDISFYDKLKFVIRSDLKKYKNKLLKIL